MQSKQFGFLSVIVASLVLVSGCTLYNREGASRQTPSEQESATTQNEAASEVTRDANTQDADNTANRNTQNTTSNTNTTNTNTNTNTRENPNINANSLDVPQLTLSMELVEGSLNGSVGGYFSAQIKGRGSNSAVGLYYFEISAGTLPPGVTLQYPPASGVPCEPNEPCPQP